MKYFKLTALILATTLLIAGWIYIDLTFVKANSDVASKFIVTFNITIIALLTLAFFVAKNLIKLLMEKRNRIVGSKFKTQLVIIFVGITLLPSIMLFIISSGLVTSYVDKWFVPLVSRPIEDSLALSAKIYVLLRKETLENAHKLRDGTMIDGKYTAAVLLKNETQELSEAQKDAFNGNNAVEVITQGDFDIIRASVPIYKGGLVDKVLSVSQVVPPEISTLVGEIQKANQNYMALREFRMPLKANYLIILGFFTLLIMFFALWMALHVSRGITVPIQNLLNATANVSRGDFNPVMETHGDDEIGMLISSFNTMIEKIKGTELSLHSAYLESERRRLSFENIVNNINSGVISLDVDNSVITINDVACKILGVKTSDVLNHHYREVIKNIKSDEFEKFIKDINLYNFFSKKDQLRVSVNGRSIVLRVFIVQLKDDKKNPVGLLVVFDDLTELIRAEKALAWQDVAKRLTHEIKNPLTPIKLSAERMLKRWNSGDANFGEILKKATGTIVREVDGIQKLVNEFSRLGKMPDIELSVTHLKPLINEVIDLYREYEHLEIVLYYNTFVDELLIDADNFKRVLINIFDNAVQAIDENGKITVIVREDETTSNIIIEVSDTGEGIRDEDKDKLFQPYFSRRKNGTGLGLAIAHRIVTEHKGMISVKDNTPKGSVFKIELPCF
ncbi:MAG: ATP-binding protein [Nitrospirae bacterium YQR-1]